MCSTPLYSFLCQCSPVHHVALYPILSCAAFRRLARYFYSLSLSFSRATFFLSLFFSNLYSFLSLRSFLSFTLPCRSLFFVLYFLASQQFFWWLASHAFIHFFRRLILLYFYTSRFVLFLFDLVVFLLIVNITSSTISSIYNFFIDRFNYICVTFDLRVSLRTSDGHWFIFTSFRRVFLNFYSPIFSSLIIFLLFPLFLHVYSQKFLFLIPLFELIVIELRFILSYPYTYIYFTKIFINSSNQLKK